MTEADWYAVLQLPPDATTEQIALAVERRSRQAAALANTAPERSQHLREQARAIKRDLLSGEQSRQQYDAARLRDTNPAQSGNAEAHPPDLGHRQVGGGLAAGQPRRPNRFMKFLQSGWTCPHCGESALPGDKFCARCGGQLIPDATYVPVTRPVDNPNACPYCGTLAASSHRFCRSCGAGRP